jgi:hypothetical protein
MHLEEVVGAVREQVATPWTEIGQSGDELLRGGSRDSVKVERGHGHLLGSRPIVNNPLSLLAFSRQ